MKAILDPAGALTQGLAAIRSEFAVPTAFPPVVAAEAAVAAKRAPGAHRDRTAERFVTLDPEGATDLDQAFCIEAAGADLLLHYAIADVAWFVAPGSALEQEAWARGETLYLPDGKAPLYPEAISQGAASLLPDGSRPAVVFSIRVDTEGQARLDAVERAVIRSVAKLAYETVTDAELPQHFAALTDRLAKAEAARGASRVDPPEQEVARTDIGYALAFRPRSPAEDRNALLSLACNLAVADLLMRAGTGLFRVMAEPDATALARLRHQAEALGLAWPAEVTLDAWERALDAADSRHAAMMTAIRRAGRGASYQPFRAESRPWHAAVAAPYAHATAPLRRLADRYVVEAALAIANGEAVPEHAAHAFDRLPPVMARADALAGRIDRAVIDLAEAIVLQPFVGRSFAVVVTEAEEDGARIQLVDLPVVARLPGRGLAPGQRLSATLLAADPGTRTVRFGLEPSDASDR